MKNCENPILCKKKHERWKKNQSRFIPIGEIEHQNFIQHLTEGKARYVMKKHSDEERPHADIRQVQRMISIYDLKDIITHGWVIERNYFPYEQAVRLVILGYTRNYRPLHVVCEVVNDYFWLVCTVYDPQSKPYKWSNNFQERVCFCKED